MKYLASFLVVLAGLSLGGCLSDPVTGPVVVARPTSPPGAVFYRTLNATDLEIRWTRSPSDTQLNFKGYWVQLWTSAVPAGHSRNENLLDSTITEVDSLHVYRNATTHVLDTSCVFTNVSMSPNTRYTAYVYGVRYPPQTSPDSVVLSDNGTALSFDVDPKPVVAPATVYASSGAGATIVNLFWKPSSSESNIGFAGYIIRYIDTIRTSGAVLVTASRIQVIDTGVNASATVRYTSINVPPNPQTLTFREYPYKFWIKAIRRDSVESADSIGIVWSGAERAQQLGVRADTGVFVGQVNTNFAIAQTTVDNAAAEFKLHFDGTNTTVTALGTTMLSTRTDTASLDNTYFTGPLQSSDFSATSIVLPEPSTSGATFYALLPGGGRARVQVMRDPSSGTYINPTTGIVLLTASFQPSFTGWPFF